MKRTASRTSTKSRLSQVVSRLTRPSKGGLEREKLPLSDLDKGVVGWESQEDPYHPLNFPQARKWVLLGLVSAITFISPFASSMFAPAVEPMNEEFRNTSTILSTLTVSIYVLGYVCGPMLLAGMCELYGRRYVLCAANVFFCVWQIGCALAPNLNSLIVFRFLSGVGGSGCMTIGGGVIADLFPPDERGLATSLYSLGPLFGPSVGPIIGGFIGQRLGWRWVFWILLISGSAVTISIECFTAETNAQVLIRRKTKRLQRELNRPDLRSVYDSGEPQSPTRVILDGLVRPLKMLFLSPLVALLSLYMAVAYGLMYLVFTTIPTIFKDQYKFSPEISGLAYIGIGVGFMGGLVTVAKISDPTVVRLTRANNGVFEPEMRLPACIFFACFVPITFFWYGWSAYYEVHWIVPIIGLVPLGFGVMGIFIPIQTYIIDSFPGFAASGMAALTISRSLFGAFLPLAGIPMYSSLGYGWGNTVLGFVAIAIIPAPLLIFKFGGRIRKNHPVKL